MATLVGVQGLALGTGAGRGVVYPPTVDAIVSDGAAVDGGGATRGACAEGFAAASGAGGWASALGPVASAGVVGAPQAKQNWAPVLRRVPHAWQNMGLLYAPVRLRDHGAATVGEVRVGRTACIDDHP
jgi:hypothetical protein